MHIKYAIFNPSIGNYSYADTVEDAISLLSKQAVDFIFEHAHNAPISKVEFADDGSEVWHPGMAAKELERSKIEQVVERILLDKDFSIERRIETGPITAEGLSVDQINELKIKVIVQEILSSIASDTV